MGPRWRAAGGTSPPRGARPRPPAPPRPTAGGAAAAAPKPTPQRCGYAPPRAIAPGTPRTSAGGARSPPRPSLPTRRTPGAAGRLRVDDSSVVLHGDRDLRERGAHLRQPRPQRPAEAVGDLLKRQAAFVPQPYYLLLRRRQLRDRAAHGLAQLAFQEALVRGGRAAGLGHLRDPGRPPAHQLAAQVV